MKKLKVLIACEYSAIIRDAFRNKGHDAWSCDIIPTEGDPKYHYICDVLSILDDGWDLMIGHPPCTYLSNAGVRHLHSVPSKNGKLPINHGKNRWNLMYEACNFFQKLQNAPINKICLENPVPHCYAKEKIGGYTQLIRPWQFGHKETKAICLWLKNLPKLQPTSIIQPPKKMTAEEKKDWHKIHYMGPSKNRSKERSKFYKGIGKAMADQWG